MDIKIRHTYSSRLLDFRCCGCRCGGGGSGGGGGGALLLLLVMAVGLVLLFFFSFLVFKNTPGTKQTDEPIFSTPRC